ncbi:hypothetical protein CPY51_08615 [Rhizobium tubonense]|uniref:Uncharacterized protein n=1 Tax=Rhizobium tubonense TaxID=484088 RepID=A0A2W4EN86_9HYPH|nr:hypothetical protein CPY51_08615 [Rhizobium tubonense]
MPRDMRHRSAVGLDRFAGDPMAVAPTADSKNIVDPVAHSSLPPEFLFFALTQTKAETKARQVKMKFNRMSKECHSVLESLFFALRNICLRLSYCMEYSHRASHALPSRNQRGRSQMGTFPRYQTF